MLQHCVGTAVVFAAADLCLFRHKDSLIERPKAHTGVARLRLMPPLANKLKHLPGSLRGNCEGQLCCHDPHLEIRVIIQQQQRSPLIARANFKFIINRLHLQAQPFILLQVVGTQRFVLLDPNDREMLDELVRGHPLGVKRFHG